jgi:hypothetical protein
LERQANNPAQDDPTKVGARYGDFSWRFYKKSTTMTLQCRPLARRGEARRRQTVIAPSNNSVRRDFAGLLTAQAEHAPIYRRGLP